MQTSIKRVKTELPEGCHRLLLHTCCAPCSGEIMAQLLFSEIDFTVFYYNPNIHPFREYEIRKEENKRYAQKYGIPFIDADYDADTWMLRAKGLEYEPEKGRRCTMCFDMRLSRVALYAYEEGFDIITSSLGISRWKNMEQVHGAGFRAAEKYPGLTYWDFNWRKNGGSDRKVELSKQETFYKQEYCGCVYSLRDTNLWRVKNGRAPIEIGELFYGDEQPKEKKELIIQ